MDLFVAFKYLHIVSMFFAVGLALSGELVIRAVAGSRDAAAIGTAVAKTKPLSGPLSGMLFLAGAAFGILAALTGQIDLLRPWLLLSYVAFAAAFTIGMTVVDPWVERLERASLATAEGGASASSGESLDAVIDDRRARLASWVMMALVATLVFLMVVKPLG